MKSSEKTESIFKALVLARNEIENLSKTRKSYTNKYLPLDDVVDHLKAVLPGHGLGYVQLPEGGTANTIGLSTRIIHSSGEWIEATAEFALTDMKGVNVSQGAGSAISYFRRYALCAAFGIVGDDDTDGNIENKKPRPDTVQTTTKDQCTKLSDELKLDDAWKKKLWNDSGKNWNNLLITLKSMKEDRDLDKAADAVFSGPENVQKVFGGKE